MPKHPDHFFTRVHVNHSDSQNSVLTYDLSSAMLPLVMTFNLIIVAVWFVLSLIAVYLATHPRKPVPCPVKAVCPHCYELHDGPMVLCEACEWACFPDGLVQEEVREQIDSVQYRTFGAE
jgi:hypothetical protein